MTLQAVPNEPESGSAPNESLPGEPRYFEGKEVHGTILVVKGVNKLDCADRVLRMDSICNLKVEARVTDVRFQVDDKDGNLYRVQVVKALDVEFQPWDPDDPDDKGVMT